MGIEYHLKNISKTLNHDLIPQIYRMNRWEYDPTTSCRFEYGDLEKPDLDELSKFVQRCFSVGAMRPTEDVESYLREVGFHLEAVEDSDDTILQTEDESRAGESMGTSGTGSSQNGGLGSSVNSDNAA